jgi:alanine racemase
VSLSRRGFLERSAAAALLGARPSLVRASTASVRAEPWLEIDGAALGHNVKTIARLAGGKPIIAVAKNNAYGLGCRVAGPILDALPEVAAIAVVRIDEALELRDAGVKKPVLLMARFDARDLE